MRFLVQSQAGKDEIADEIGLGWKVDLNTI